MAQKQNDSLGLTLVAAILAMRSESHSNLDEQELAAQARRLLRACEAELLKPEPKPPIMESLPESVAKLLRSKSHKPPTFNTVVRAVVGGSKVADRRKLLRDYLQDSAETELRKRTRPLDLGTPREFDPELTLRKAVACMEKMQKPGFFTKTSVKILATDFSRWKAQRNQRVWAERSQKASAASVKKRAAKRSSTGAEGR